MMNKIIAYCGLVCSDCPAYIATQENDWEMLEEGAALARERLNQPEVTAEMGLCDGCTGEGYLSACTDDCQVRVCGVEHGVLNCAYCPDYPCQKLTALWTQMPKAQTVLDEIRQSL